MTRMRRGPELNEYLHSPDQYLNPEAIYTLNWVLGEMLDAEGVVNKQQCWIVPNLFDKKTRSWHSACVLKGFFDPEKVVAVAEKARLFARIANSGDLAKAFDLAKSNLLEGRSYEDARRRLEKPSDSDKSVLHRALLLLYHGFKIHRAQLLPGILYRGCLQYNSETVVEYFEGQSNPQNPTELTCWSYKDHQHQVLGEGQSIDQFNYDGISKIDFDNRGGELARELIELFYFRELATETKDVCAPVIVLPIYDMWLGGWGYGGLWGCLILTFKDDTAKSEFRTKHLNNLRGESEWLASWLEVSAMAVLSGQPINPPYDLVEHFLRMLIHMQDWERVAVFRRNRNEKPRLLYCYQRNNGSFTEDADWERCNPDGEKCRSCEEKNWKRKLKWDSNQRDGDSKWTIWSRDIMPELTQEEIDAWGGITCEFEYPQSVYVPTDHITTKLFEFALIDQQIRVFRTLISKVRARRAALRNAAVSIMGRNMSHNIGSHVLARMSTSGLAETKEVSQLLAFLQERMDFIAEVSTTRSFMNLPTYFYGEVISHFAGAAALPGGKYDSKNPGQTLLLNHISGIEKRPAVVKSMNTATEEYRFGCPGGTVGRHALYVIIENIIRNTAKHAGAGTNDSVEVFIRVCEDSKHSDYYQVTVWDRVGNGQKLVELKGEQIQWVSDANGATKDCLLMPSGLTVQAYQENQKKKVATADSIQLVIEKEPLIDADGTVRPNYWGVREIYLAAAYLRSIPLEELETPADGPPILQALLMDDNGCVAGDQKNKVSKATYKNLGYRFYLERAHVAAVIREQDPGCNTEKLKRHGIEVHRVDGATDQKKKEEFQSLLKKGFRHTYLVVPNQQHEDWLNDPSVSRSRLPVAVLVEDPALDLSKPKSVEQKLAKRYLTQMLRQSNSDQAKAFATGDPEKAGACIPYKIIGKFVSALTKSKDIQLSENPGDIIKAQNALIFDYHGQVAETLEFSIKKLAELGFYERYRSESAQKHIVMESVSSRKRVNQSLLTIAALTRVMILDERLQGALNEMARSWDNGIVGNFLELARIFVPPAAECDLNHPKAEEITKWIAQSYTYQDSPFAWNVHRMDFLVVHQGILDRLSDENGQKHQDPKQWLKNLAKCLGCEDRIVVCSGRGAPSTIPDFARFVPVSTILAWTIHRPSKFHLVNALWHARHPELILEGR